MNINLEALGITEAAFTKAVLSQLNLTEEQAVKALAEKLGVNLSESGAGISTGDSVLTTQGESVAQVLTPAEIATLRDAAAISTRIFSVS